MDHVIYKTLNLQNGFQDKEKWFKYLVFQEIMKILVRYKGFIAALYCIDVLYCQMATTIRFFSVTLWLVVCILEYKRNFSLLNWKLVTSNMHYLLCTAYNNETDLYSLSVMFKEMCSMFADEYTVVFYMNLFLLHSLTVTCYYKSRKTKDLLNTSCPPYPGKEGHSGPCWTNSPSFLVRQKSVLWDCDLHF